MNQKTPLAMIFIFLLITNPLFSQSSNENSHNVTIEVPEVALIGIHSTKSNISLQGNTAIEAGKKIEFNSIDNSTWVNYSSIVGSKTDPSRYVTVQITDGRIPDGLNLLIKAEKDNGRGEGKMGKPVKSNQILKNTPIKLIEQIGSCYTGKGVNKGHNITYQLILSDEENAFQKLDFDQSQIIAVTYTLSDN